MNCATWIWTLADSTRIETFGSISLSSDETTVAYVAERKAADEKGPEKFMFKPDWGEKFTKKPPPCIAICDLETEEVSIMKEQENLAVGQVVQQTRSMIPHLHLTRLAGSIWS